MAEEEKDKTATTVTAGTATATAAAPEAPAPASAPAPRPGGPGRRPGPGGRPGGRGEGGPRKFFRRKKVCKFCVEKIDSINYKDVRLLQQFVAERGKIVPRRLTGVCTPHQRRLTAAIKQARNIALLPFAARY
jgi:small subunit ribosomal protein S18